MSRVRMANISSRSLYPIKARSTTDTPGFFIKISLSIVANSVYVILKFKLR